MKRKILLLISIMALQPRIAYPDLFGGDVAVLSQILVQTIQQLHQLKEAVNTSKENLQLIREINQGLNETLKLTDSLDLPMDASTRQELKSLKSAQGYVEHNFGKSNSWNNAGFLSEMQRLSAEGFHSSQRLHDNAKRQKERADRIRRHSHSVSPGGAQKLTAESQAVLIDGVNQSVISQAETQRLLSASLAMDTRRESQATESNIAFARELSDSFSKAKISHSLPRF